MLPGRVAPCKCGGRIRRAGDAAADGRPYPGGMAEHDMSPYERRQRMSWGAGIGIGVAVGVALGMAFDNMLLGVSIGLVIGICLAVAMGVGRTPKPRGGATGIPPEDEERPEDEAPDSLR